MEFFHSILIRGEGVASWLLFWLLPLAGLGCAWFYGLSMPLRREERSRFFLDLIETGNRQGWSIRQTLVTAATRNDPVLGPRFHLVAAHVESGLDPARALERVSGFLLPSILATIKVGMELGHLDQAVILAKRSLKAGFSKFQSGTNYQIVLFFVLNPIFLLASLFCLQKVLPVLFSITAGFQMTPSSGLGTLVEWLPLLLRLQIFAGSVFAIMTFLYFGGNRLSQWLESGLGTVLDRWTAWIPWKRKRLQSHFLSMLSLLLDSGIPEEKAVLFAAESTGNRRMAERGRELTENLKAGIGLAEALSAIDHSGELAWRLGNAGRGGSKFFAALNGWCEVLEAKAYQQEQFFSQCLTTMMVIMNGLIVALISMAYVKTILDLGTWPLR